MYSLLLHRKRHTVMAMKQKPTMPSGIPILALVCSPPLDARVMGELEGVLAWCEVLVVNEADVVVEVAMVVVRGEVFIIGNPDMSKQHNEQE